MLPADFDLSQGDSLLFTFGSSFESSLPRSSPSSLLFSDFRTTRFSFNLVPLDVRFFNFRLSLRSLHR